MHRFVAVLLMASMVLLLVPPSAPAVLPALGPAAVYTAKFLGEYLVGKVALDPLWDKAVGADERVAELDKRLLAYETMLRQVDVAQAAEIAKLRRALDTKTSADDVRRIVNETLGQLRERVKEIEGRLTEAEKRTFTLEQRVAAIEDLFGRITYFPPTPLVMRDGGDGKPAPHPRVKEWLTLLCKSEESRIKLIELRRDYEDSAEAVQKARAEDKKLVEASQKLHRTALEEVSGGLIEISAFRPGSLRRLPTEERLAGLMWLVAVTKPVSAGEWKGRLGVPAALFGSQACEILEACELSGVENAQVLGLYRRGLAAECAAKPVYSGGVAPGVLSKELQSLADEWQKGSPVLRKLLRETRTIDVRYRKTAEQYGPRHEKMIAVENEKQRQVVFLKLVAKAVEQGLMNCVRAYVKAVQEGERPTNARMTAFRNGVLAPVCSWRAALECADAQWKERVLVDAAWARLCKIEANSDFLGELKGHEGGVYCVAFSPDGQRIVSGSADYTLKVWDAQSGQEVLCLKGHGHFVKGVAYSPDGKRIVSASQDKTLKVWDARTGRELLSLKGHTATVYCVAYSPDGQRIVSGSGDETLKVWDAQTGQEVLCLKGHEYRVFRLAYSPDGKRIASASPDKTLRVWDAQTGRQVLCLRDNGWVNCVAYSPDGKRIVSGNDDKMLRVRDAQTGEEIFSIKGLRTSVGCVAYSPDGKRIVSDGTALTREFLDPLPRSPDGKLIVPDGIAHRSFGTLTVWDAQTGRELLPLRSKERVLWCVAYSPDGKRIVSGHSRTLRVWDASTGAPE